MIDEMDQTSQNGEGQSCKVVRMWLVEGHSGAGYGKCSWLGDKPRGSARREFS